MNGWFLVFFYTKLDLRREARLVVCLEVVPRYLRPELRRGKTSYSCCVLVLVKHAG